MGTKFTIKNTPILFERTAFSRVATITVWSKLGARDEQKNSEFGLTHFLEHMLFKGTKTRNAKTIAEEIEGIGGDLDAFTSRDNLCLIAKVPTSKIQTGFNILSDLLSDSIFQERQIELEKSVVKEELRMAEDDFDDSGDEHFMTLAYDEQQLGRSILGTNKSIDSFTRNSLKNYLKTRFNPSNTIISIAADVEQSEIESHCTNLINKLNNDLLPTFDNTFKKQVMNKGDFKKHRSGMDGVNIYLAFETFSGKHKDRYPLAILNNILGNGMSSRLFQKIREEKGLAYSVYSSISYSRNEGNLFLSSSTSKENYLETLKLMENECYSLFKTITLEEFNRSKSQLTGSLEMGLETSSNFTFFNVRNEMIYNKLISIDDILLIVNNISYENVVQLAENILSEENSIRLIYGNIN